jgi:hypothetical protein
MKSFENKALTKIYRKYLTISIIVNNNKSNNHSITSRVNKERIMKKDVNVSRRKFLVCGTGAIVSGGIAGCLGGALALVKPKTAKAAVAPSPIGYLPAPPFTVPIDTKLVRALCFRHYMLSGG